MKHCELLHKDLFAYIEKELPPVLIQQLDKHISECEECNRVLTEFKGVLALIDDKKSVETRPFAETRILQGIESRLEKRSTAPFFTRILKPALFSIGISAALAVGFFIGSDFAGTIIRYSQNEEMTESMRTDLNVPEFMTDDIIYFTE